MAAVDGVWFGCNDNFTSARLTLDQEALYTAQFGSDLPDDTGSVFVSQLFLYLGWGDGDRRVSIRITLMNSIATSFLRSPSCRLVG